MSDPGASLAWWERVGAFTLMHVLSAGLLLGLIAAAVVLGVRWRGTWRERVLRTTWALAMFCFLGCVSMYYLFSGRFGLDFALPLHVCDLMGFVSCLALLSRWRWLRTLTVFWGLALCSQAFVTPILQQPPTHIHFWYFWFGHTAIVGGAVYLIVVDGYRARAGDLAWGVASLYAYVGLVVPMNIANGWNYGFVGNVPRAEGAEPTILDVIGPWPQRVYMLGMLAAVGMGLVYAGFRLPRWIGRRGE